MSKLQSKSNFPMIQEQASLANREAQLSYFGWITELPDPDPILLSQGTDISTYRSLLIDSHLSAVLSKRKSGVMSMEWEIKANKSPDNVRDFIQDYFDNMIKLEKIGKKILDCIYYGYQPFVLNWVNKDNYLLPTIEDRPQEYFFFDISNKLRIRTRDLTGILADEMIFVTATCDDDYLNPYGDRVAKKVFWPTTFKKGGLKFWLKMTEKYGMPQAVGKVPKTAKPQARREFARTLENMIQDGVTVINNDETVELLDAGSRTGSADLYKGLLNFCNYEISKAVLTVVNTVEVGEHGSFAASDTQYSGEGKLNLSDVSIISSFFNKVIRLIVDYNFGVNVPAPKFTKFEADNVDKTLAERDGVLTQQGVKFTKKYYMSNYNLQEEDFDLVTVTPSNADASTEGEQKQKESEQALKGLNLNGAQVTSAVGIIEGVMAGTMPRESGINQLQIFIGLTKEQAEAVIGKVEVKAPAQPPAPAFAEKSEMPIDKILKSIPDKLLNIQMQKVLKPVIDLVDKCSTFEEMNSKLAEMFPEMDTEKLEDILAKAMFIASIESRNNA